MIRLSRIILYLLLALVLPTQANSHALEPGYLEIKPFGQYQWRIFWSRPDVAGAPMKIDAVLTSDCTPSKGSAPTFNGTGWITAWVATCSSGLVGQSLTIEGLENTRTDVLARIAVTAGNVQAHRLTPGNTGLEIQGFATGWSVIKAYLSLGIEHILGGVDHLLFVFALLLLIVGRWRLVGAITAFTVAHSITMAAASLGYVSLPGPPVEAVIALSIMFLASELVLRRSGQMRLSERYPWIVSFCFGLLHGFGFAGALREIGLPQGDVPLALLSFNIGVEIGQLAFVALVLILAWGANRLAPMVVRIIRDPDAKIAVISAYAIGGVSAYWFIDRLSGFI
ncbi:MAG: HupE/UreJ family protein [Rhizobiaceae bacterium]